MPVEIRIRKGEPMERALRRLKKKLDREGVIRDVRAKRYFEKPCETKRRKKKAQAFAAMLRARYENR
jgi:small subunit ribosomal protein S21